MSKKKKIDAVEELEKTLMEELEKRGDTISRILEKKKHAIAFAEFVSNDPVFDDFWSMSKEHQEKIYQQFLNQNKDERSKIN